MSLPPLPVQNSDTLWPTKEWSHGDFPAHADKGRVDAFFERAFASDNDPEWGKTNALLVFHEGKLIKEQYAPDCGPDKTMKSWSMAKSITHALVGLLVKDGLLDVSKPADVPEWYEQADDPRQKITLDHLLRMSSGLKWDEAYTAEGESDVVDMLYRTGKADMGAFAANFPLAQEPDTLCHYSSGTTNIITRLIKEKLGVDQDGMLAYMKERLFDPLGMSSAIPKFDGTGTFIGSSFCFCTAHDFAKFAHLYLRDGVWNGTRLLPEGWVDYARTPTPLEDTPGWDYGAHFYVRKDHRGSFNMSGHEGQYIVMVPSSDLIIVRLGLSESGVQTPNVRLSLWDIVESFDDK